MPPFFVLFSKNIDDINFARSKSLCLVLYAADISMLRQISESSSHFIVFASSDSISNEFLSLAEKKIFSYSEYKNRLELEDLISDFIPLPEETENSSDKNDFSSYKELCELSPTFASLAGNSLAMQKLRQTIIQVAAFDVSVLILGETGTGKTTVARAVHELSSRRKKVFKNVVISNMNESLVEAKLFGVSEGGFTGAVAGKGLFEECDGGTLLFDEIGEISMNIQTKLLQVLSEGMINRIGSNKDIPVDNRMIFATNANLEAKIRSGQFREDLFYRINDVTLRIPPLRERLEDIPELAEAYFKREKINKKISPSTLALLQTFSWKGNVRQLEKVLKNAAILYCKGDTIEPKDIRL